MVIISIDKMAADWWSSSNGADVFTPYHSCGNPQFVNLGAVMVAFGKHLVTKIAEMTDGRYCRAADHYNGTCGCEDMRKQLLVKASGPQDGRE